MARTILPPHGPEREKMLREAVEIQAQTGNASETARRMKLDRCTLRHRLKAAQRDGIYPSPAEPEKPRPYTIPDGIDLAPGPLHISDPHRALIINDIHIPYHERGAVETAIRDGVEFGATMVILNGDIMDCGSVSRHAKSVRERMSWPHEREAGKAFMAALRAAFPKARILYRPGNHERRMPMFLAANAPELAEMAELRLDVLLGLAGYGIEWIEDQTPLSLGGLHIRHGDEWRIGAGVINPAKIAGDRARVNVIIGHYHRDSKYTHRAADGSVTAAWSTGCLCNLRPAYMPENNWAHGYALVDSDGHEFRVEQRTIIHGRAY